MGRYGEYEFEKSYDVHTVGEKENFNCHETKKERNFVDSVGEEKENWLK